jgi:hypothetical protein
MYGQELINIMLQSHRRVHIIGTPENGIIVALDLEGRLFEVLNGRVLNRVVPESIVKRTNNTLYLNPGGDALWPAPEGNCYGYEYNTGKWRVPPSITGAVWEVTGQFENMADVRAEIDLVNNRQVGIPCEFKRHIKMEHRNNTLIQYVNEIIRYIGTRTLKKNEFSLAPWSLCQFTSGEKCKVIMPYTSKEDIRDMYDSSLSKRWQSGDQYIVNTQTDFRFQLGLSKNVPWIEFISDNDIRVKRYTGILPRGQKYIDISDIPPDQLPSDFGDKLSIYCDPSGFMEMEACGGCPDILLPGAELSVDIITEYTNMTIDRS